MRRRNGTIKPGFQEKKGMRKTGSMGYGMVELGKAKGKSHEEFLRTGTSSADCGISRA